MQPELQALAEAVEQPVRSDRLELPDPTVRLEPGQPERRVLVVELAARALQEPPELKLLAQRAQVAVGVQPELRGPQARPDPPSRPQTQTPASGLAPVKLYRRHPIHTSSSRSPGSA